MDIEAALAWLDDRVDLEKMAAGGERSAPTLERIEAIVAALGHPERDQPTIHITGTNGKGSVSAMATSLLLAAGVNPGTYTSPHIRAVNERIAVGGVPIDDAALAESLTAVALAEEATGVRPSFFEAVTAAGYRRFSDDAVEAAVVEVGMAGRWDATNVVDAAVAVVTNVGLDHTEYLGTDRRGIAEEKAGIIKEGSTLILGETDPTLADVFSARPAGQVLSFGDQIHVDGAVVAVGGIAASLRTPRATYIDVHIPLHGLHQAVNAALALGAVEALLDIELSEEVVNEGFGAVKVPGRLEVIGTGPVVIVDGAHNPAAGAAQLAALDSAFGTESPRRYVIGMLGRDPGEFLASIGIGKGHVVTATQPDSPRAVPAADIARAAETLGATVSVEPDPHKAIQATLDDAHLGDIVIITGSLYLTLPAHLNT